MPKLHLSKVPFICTLKVNIYKIFNDFIDYLTKRFRSS
uniref:Uncharacterized protein n=1 Tax=Rhizophora mucronata TaxID=61149 RepID=A0A2P2KYU7_RHIMU